MDAASTNVTLLCWLKGGQIAGKHLRPAATKRYYVIAYISFSQLSLPTASILEQSVHKIVHKNSIFFLKNNYDKC